MEFATVKEIVETAPKGANIVLEWERDCKVRKSVTDSIRKRTHMAGRLGVEYDNLKAVKDKRESGELPEENAGLPWGEWLQYPLFISHKGNIYLRLYTGTSATAHPYVTFLKNGEKIEKAAIENCLLASELTASKGDCFVVKVADMTSIHWTQTIREAGRDETEATETTDKEKA
jgi:hypothetical protein